jgi:pimeloyl-ACP methyl ester carboxylesterase
VRFVLYGCCLTTVVLAANAAAAPGRDPCIPLGAKHVRVHGGVLVLSMSVLGKGPRGVVLSNQSDNNPCAWLPFANRLVRSGFRVAVYYYSGEGAYKDTVAVAAKLRSLGAKRIALVGASEGAKSSIAAAAKARASGVVSLSAELDLDGYGNLLPAARKLKAPVLYVYAKEDSLAEVNTPLLYKATRERDKQLVALPGLEHGTELLAHPSVRDRILRFLAQKLS